MRLPLHFHTMLAIYVHTCIYSILWGEGGLGDMIKKQSVKNNPDLPFTHNGHVIIL